jgi:L-malate glycosyltransferase
LFNYKGVGFIWLICRLILRGYSDATICDLNRTLTVRLLVALAKPVGRLLPFTNRSAMFFFFPFLHVGGAERVHADIVGCFSSEKPWVFFTKKSDNDKFKALFPAESRLFNIWSLLKYGYPFSIGIMAGLINRHENPIVFGSNSLFYYLLVPYLKPYVRRVDLLHAFGGASDEFSLPVVDRLDRRVVITEKTTNNLMAQYRSAGIDPHLLERVVLIENRIQVPAVYPEKATGKPIKAIYVGRGAPEKRVHLVGRAASLCRERLVHAHFILVGDTREAIEASDRKNCLFMGEISDTGELERIYADADVLVLTSSREGFPMVIMESMAHGVVPVCTAVGGIPTHVHHAVNGLLLENGSDEVIVEQLVSAITRLEEDRKELLELSRAAFDYARQHFSGADFCAAYHEILLGKKN